MHVLRRLTTPILALLLALPFAAHAAAVLESMTGDVRAVAAKGQKFVALKAGQRVLSGSTLVTGTNGMAVLRFDDEQKLVLAPNSELGIVDYHYRANAASADRAELALRRGALRVSTGLIARRNSDMFVVHTPHVHLGVRGTGADFAVTIIGQSYWSVNEGAVAASTNVGKGVFGKGAYGRSAALDRLATGLSSAGLPVAVLALFHELNTSAVTAQLAPPPGAAMAAAEPVAEKSSDSGGGVAAGGMVGLAAAVAAALAAAGGGGSGGGAPATTHH